MQCTDQFSPAFDRLLLIRTSAFGDVVQTYYVISDLRRVFPNASIDWCVDERFVDLARLHPGVRTVISFPSRQWKRNLFSLRVWIQFLKWMRALRSLSPDVSLDLQGLYKSALIGYVSGATLRLGPGREAESERGVNFLYHRKAQENQRKGLAARGRHFASACLGYSIEHLALESGVARPPPLKSQHGRRIYLVIGASRSEKLWPLQNWSSFCKQLLKINNVTIELLWGSSSELYSAEVIKRQVSHPAILVAAEMYSIEQLVHNFRDAALVVGGDTGLVHLGVALGTPTVMLFLFTDSSLYTHTDLKNLFFIDEKIERVTAESVLLRAHDALNWSEGPGRASPSYQSLYEY